MPCLRKAAQKVSKRLPSAALLILCFGLVGCIAPYRGTDNTKVQEFDAGGKHWIYKEHAFGRAGVAVIAGHGGWASSPVKNAKSIEVAGGAPMNVLDRIAVIQANGEYRHYEPKKGKHPWFDVYMYNDRIYLALKDDPQAATDASAYVKGSNRYSGGEIDMLGEWDPGTMEFRIDRYFPEKLWLFSAGLKREDILKAAIFGAPNPTAPVTAGRAGVAVISGHGGWVGSGEEITKTIQVDGGTPMHVLDRIAVLQASGEYRHYKPRKGGHPCFDTFIHDGRIYLVLMEDPQVATDASVDMERDKYYPGDQIEMLGEWDPDTMEFRIDRYFTERLWLFDEGLKREDIPKAAIFGAPKRMTPVNGR